MKSLTDVIQYDEQKNVVELGFKISSINKELAVNRVQSLNAYFKTADKQVKAE